MSQIGLGQDYTNAHSLISRDYKRIKGTFYIVSSGYDEIDEIQEFQDRVYAGLPDKGKILIRPRSAAERNAIKQNGGFHFTARDMQTHKIVGIMLGSCATSQQEYENKINLSQQAGRPCIWKDKCLVLSTTFIDQKYQASGIAEALFEVALEVGSQNGFDGYGFVIGHDNRAYLKCALNSGFSIVGSGIHKALGTKMFLFERAPVSDIAFEQEHVKLVMTQTIFDSINIENYLDDNYVIVDMGLYHPSFTFARQHASLAAKRQSA